MKNFGKAKRFALESGNEDLLIEALAPVEGRDEYRSIAFRASRIDYLFSFDEKLSGIVLDNGVTIPVLLPFADLKKSIYNNDFETGSSVDLTLVTGKPVSEEKELRLSKKFNPAAEDAAPATETPREIVAFAHMDASDRKFKLLRFRESDIAFFEPHSERKDRETFVRLKAGCNADGWNCFYISTPMHYFTWYLAEAQKEGRSLVDMTEHTRPKDSASLRM
jgi:hypothetical protein